VATRTPNSRFPGTEGPQLKHRLAFHGECGIQVRRENLTGDIDHDEFDDIDEMREEFDYFADRLLSGNEVHPRRRTRSL